MDPWSACITAALDAVGPRVVSVSATDPAESQMTFATGLCLDDRHVVTHGRLCSPRDRLAVEFPGGRRVEAELLASDPLYLIAVLKLGEDVALPPLEPAPPEELRPGVLCLALGNALRTEAGVALGLISAVDRTVYRPERFPVDGLIVTDAAVRVQDIGGPLVTLEGRLLGISATPASVGPACAVEAPVLRRLVDQMLRFGRASHPWLGFSGQTEVVPEAMASLLGVRGLRGLAVASVADGGPGQRAGVRVLDLVVSADGRDVETAGAIRRVLAEHRPGEDVRLSVLRGGQFTDLAMPVEEIPHLTRSWPDAQA
jgi:serine protease Do